MKTRFWKVQIETLKDGTVTAAVLGSRQAEGQPSDGYKREPGREIYSLWFGNEAEARGAAIEALAMNREQEAAA